ncbi:class I SAM-dependent methyltransferase, partial [Bacteroidetes/Chlorobi group bacterium ChocPot_Mid]
MDAIFIRTHLFNKKIIEHIKQISLLIENVFVVYDQTNRDAFPDIGVPVIPFTVEDYENSGYPIATLEQIYELPTPPPLGSRSAAIYFNPEYAQLLAMKKLDEQGKKYDNYWYYEYDVLFNGNIRHFFSLCSKNNADLLTTNIRQFPFEPTFKKFWNMLSFQLEDEKQQLAMYGPLWRASRRFMEILDNEYKSGKHGYYETIIPTLAVMNDMTIADINSIALMYNPLTFNGDAIKKFWSQEFVNNMTNMLFHPVRPNQSAFLFATGYISDVSHFDRYINWIKYYWSKKDLLGTRNLVIIDDGSDIKKISKLKNYVSELAIPFEIYNAEELPDSLIEGINWIRFNKHLGRINLYTNPGWWRSFSFASVLLEKYNYDKVIHLESDTFIISVKLFKFIYEDKSGWTTLWSNYCKFPETCVQIIQKKNIKPLRYVYDNPSLWSKAKTNSWFIAEFVLPFTNIVKSFVGDRYGEDWCPEIPANADYAANMGTLTDMGDPEKRVQPKIKYLMQILNLNDNNNGHNNSNKKIIEDKFDDIWEKCKLYNIEQKKEEFVPLLKILDKMPKKINALEIGFCDGGTSRGFCEIFDNVYSIDISNPHKTWGMLMEEKSNWHCFSADSHSQETYEMIKSLGLRFNFIFIDGDHTEEGVKKDFEMYKDFLEDDGIIAFHDILDTNYHRKENCYVSKFWKNLRTKEFYKNEIIWTEGRNPDFLSHISNKEWGGIGYLDKICKEERMKRNKGLTAHHSGAAGDIVYAIPTFKKLGIKNIILDPSKRYGPEMSFRPWLDEKICNSLKPFLESQGYNVIISKTDTVWDYDFDIFRNCGFNMEVMHIALMQATAMEVDINLSEAWINIENPNPVADIVINWTPRWHNNNFNAWDHLLNDYSQKKIIYVGLKEDYDKFLSQYRSLDFIKFQDTENIYDMARIIAGAKIFIGNQSLAYAIAEGL